MCTRNFGGVGGGAVRTADNCVSGSPPSPVQAVKADRADRTVGPTVQRVRDEAVEVAPRSRWVPPGLALRPYFNRYTEDAIDLCDVLASFSPQNKASLHELCRVMGLPGKPDSIGGADVERYYREGRMAEVAAYCETDVVNTYRAWLRYELFRGRLSENGLQASEANLRDYIKSRSNSKPHLASVKAEERGEDGSVAWH